MQLYRRGGWGVHSTMASISCPSLEASTLSITPPKLLNINVSETKSLQKVIIFAFICVEECGFIPIRRWHTIHKNVLKNFEIWWSITLKG